MKRIGIFLTLFIPSIAFAAPGVCGESDGGLIENPIAHLGICTIPEFLGLLLSLLVKISIPVIAVLIIFTGFTYATSKGDPGKLKKAHDMFLYIILGAGLLFAAKGLQMAIQSTIDTLK